MRFALLLLGLAAVAYVQLTWLSGFGRVGLTVDVVLLVLVYSAAQLGAQRGQILGFAVGLLEDALGLSPLGYYAVVRLTIGLVSGTLKGKLHEGGALRSLVLVTVALGVRYVSASLVALATNLTDALGRMYSGIGLVEAGITLALAPVAFWVIVAVERLSGGWFRAL